MVRLTSSSVFQPPTKLTTRCAWMCMAMRPAIVCVSSKIFDSTWAFPGRLVSTGSVAALSGILRRLKLNTRRSTNPKNAIGMTIFRMRMVRCTRLATPRPCSSFRERGHRIVDGAMPFGGAVRLSERALERMPRAVAIAAAAAQRGQLEQRRNRVRRPALQHHELLQQLDRFAAIAFALAQRGRAREETSRLAAPRHTRDERRCAGVISSRRVSLEQSRCQQVALHVIPAAQR